MPADFVQTHCEHGEQGPHRYWDGDWHEPPCPGGRRTPLKGELRDRVLKTIEEKEKE